jgi:hypothetical protein
MRPAPLRYGPGCLGRSRRAQVATGCLRCHVGILGAEELAAVACKGPELLWHLYTSGAATTSWQLNPRTPSPHANASSVSTAHYRPLDGTPTGRDHRPTLASNISRSNPIPATYARTNQRTRAHNHTAYRPPTRGVAPGPPYTPHSLELPPV